MDSMRRPLAGFFALAILGTACAIPTEMPNWDTRWDLPLPVGDDLGIGVARFLPAGVDTLTLTGATAPIFRATVSVNPQISRSLGATCPSCPSATAPKPAFTLNPAATTTVSLTAASSLTSATLSTGSQLALSLINGFGFDPIRPPGTGTTPGTVSFTVTNGTATLGTLVIDGATSALPGNGATSNFVVPLSGTINFSSPITVTMTMVSPAGNPGSNVTMNPGQVFTATATPTLNISTATVNTPARTINDPGDPIDLTGIDASIADRIPDSTTTQGALLLTVVNPFTVGGTFNITFTGTKPSEGGTSSVPITPVSKSFAIPAGTATTPSTTGVELRQIIGSNLTAAFTGSVPASTTPSIVTPASEIAVTGRMQLHLYVRKFD
jgi:hypothetical protein